ncbi:unnamed protein product [Darwinula stevensoni]|uniref:Glycine N-methyltransferase n=1 Tax=Darwinula stevensoni TaxID=69355 RepID=A0A7R9A339_9CRUS|nr:unnamed protein product [Darwinula stevensoni]CAG0890957.1 unnamed protein product [Darwinula stevensoni]
MKVIEEANWLTLPEDIESGGGFDAVICLGNSFAHLPDFQGDQADHRLSLKNFAEFVKPGGIFLIDHRNYDYILDTGKTPAKNIYYNSKYIKDITTSTVYKEGKAYMVTMDYCMDTTTIEDNFDATDSKYAKKGRLHGKALNHFRLSYYPHRLNDFIGLLKEACGPNSAITTYGDFKPVGEVPDPAFYIHVVQKPE